MTSGSNCRHLNRPQNEEARRSIWPAYHGVTAKLQHFHFTCEFAHVLSFFWVWSGDGCQQLGGIDLRNLLTDYVRKVPADLRTILLPFVYGLFGGLAAVAFQKGASIIFSMPAISQPISDVTPPILN